MLLTRNEEPNVRACLESLAQQTSHDFEVILIDAASNDRTVPIALEATAEYPVPIRIEASKRRLPIGEARNRGVALAKADNVAFISADAEADPQWVEYALENLAHADMVFSRQLHAPHRWTTGAAVRGLRYHFPDGVTADPLRYASNVAAAYRKEVLVAFPFDAWANAAEDVLLARRANKAGYRPAYNHRMTVRHHDVARAAQELRKTAREGRGWGLYRGELGLFLPVLVWGLLVLVSLGGALATLHPAAWLLFLLILWLPAIRRAAKRWRAMPKAQIGKGVVASPAFDLTFLATYITGLMRRPHSKSIETKPQETLE